MFQKLPDFELLALQGADEAYVGFASALELASAVEEYPFEKREERYGPRGVFQNFFSCEERQIPFDSPVREFSRECARALMRKGGWRFDGELCFNDHLILKYPAHAGVALGAHRDYSEYRNLIVSITLRGRASFNLHPEPDVRPNLSYAMAPGWGVAMVAPGFMGREERPWHSVSGVGEERISLILKQRKES